MATMVQPIVRVRELTREEAWVMFDSTAQFLLEMSGAEALRRIESGDVFDLDPNAVDAVSLLIPPRS